MGDSTVDPSGDFTFIQTKDLVAKLDLTPEHELVPELPELTSNSSGNQRSMDFHPSRRFAYIINGYTETIMVCKVNENRLIVIEEVSSVPEGWSDASGVIDYFTDTHFCDIRVSPNGKLLYAINQGQKTIGIFQID